MNRFKNLENAITNILTGNVAEAKIKHPNQQAIDVHEPEKDEITAQDFKKLRSMKKKPDGTLHNCATHVEHAEYGKGSCITEAHADPDEDGNIAWYVVEFNTGVRKVNTDTVRILAAESHKH